jgi:hypothetical protein
MPAVAAWSSRVVVLWIGRAIRIVTASLFRILESGEPEYGGARAGHCVPS